MAGLDEKGPLMSRFTRRSFLTRASLGAAAVGVAAVPGMSGLLSGASSEAPEIDNAASDLGAASGGPLVAHIADLGSGQISFYSGETQVLYRDPALVARLVQA